MERYSPGSRPAATAVLGVLALVAATAGLLAADSARSRVVQVRNPRAISGRGVCDPKETALLFDRALAELTGEKTPAGSWKSLGLVPTDVVAVKINCNNWTITLSPQPELVEALCLSLQTVIPANQIIIYDNEASALKESGFVLNSSAGGVRFIGTDQGAGFDDVERLTTIVTRTATKVINLASLKCVEEKDEGASLLLKNHIGSLVPGDMPKCHGNPDFLAGVAARPGIKNKTMLNIVAGLRASYRRGVPWYWSGILMGKDTVATETAAIGVINEKRKLEGVADLPLHRYLTLAATKYGLGTFDMQRIELIKKEL